MEGRDTTSLGENPRVIQSHAQASKHLIGIERPGKRLLALVDGQLIALAPQPELVLVDPGGPQSAFVVHR